MIRHTQRVRALAWSLFVHALALGAIALRLGGEKDRIAVDVDVEVSGDVRADEAATEERVDRRASDGVERRAPGDADRAVAHAGAPTSAPNPDARAGAAARSGGHGAGAPTIVTGRADAATLRAQPLDALDGYQLARIRTAATRESREEVRATPHPAPTPWLSSAAGQGHARATRDERRSPTTPPPTTSDDADHALVREAARAEAGFARPDVQAHPAATEAATRSDDVADRVEQSLVSDEKQPAKLELTRPTSPGRETSGRGDGARGYAPSATGAAPVPAGAPSLPDGRALALATWQREYERYLSDVKRKIDPLWEFPRDLAVRLESGDVLVSFTIRRDGRVSALKVVKPSGFPSFDKNVVAAIKKAQPFAPLPTTLGTELHVTAPFESANPVIR